jgi:hypothetical protein
MIKSFELSLPLGCDRQGAFQNHFTAALGEVRVELS